MLPTYTPTYIDPGRHRPRKKRGRWLVRAAVLLIAAAGVIVAVPQWREAARDLGADMSTRLDEVFHGIIPVKLNRLEQYQSDRYADLTDDLIKAEVRATAGTATIPGLVDVMAGLGFFGVL